MTTTLEYTNVNLLHAVCADIDAPRQRTVTGYGSRLPTRYRLQYGDESRWRRVYVRSYGNSGSAFIRYHGRDVYLDTDTEYALSDGVLPDSWRA